jgi:hypothetical protein
MKNDNQVCEIEEPAERCGECRDPTRRPLVSTEPASIARACLNAVGATLVVARGGGWVVVLLCQHRTGQGQALPL